MTENIININEIKQLIPHRYPFLLVDKVKDIVFNKSCTGIKNFTINEEFFNGHFPNEPIVPGVILIEAMAQTAAILTAKSLDHEPNTKGVLFADIKSAKFKKPVTPGDTFEMRIKILREKMNFYTIEGEGYVDNVLVVNSVFTALVHDIKKQK